MNRLPVQKKYAVCFTILAFIALLTQNALSDFTLVDDFEQLTDGSINTRAGWECADATFTVESTFAGTTSKTLLAGTTSNYASKRIQPVNDGMAGTLYLEFYCSDLACNTSVGFADASATPAWNNFRAQISLDAAGVFKARSADQFLVLDQSGSLQANTWYSLWIVADNRNDVFRAYIKGGVFTEQTPLTSGAASNFAFRNSFPGTDPLARFAYLHGDKIAGIVIDNIFVDTGATNLNEIAHDDLLLRWSFDDQGFGGSSDMTATFRHTGIGHTVLTPRSGYTNGQLLQTNASGSATYIDSTGANAVQANGAAVETDRLVWMVGDWNDGSVGGGNILANAGKTVNPSGITFSGCGGLYLQTNPYRQRNLKEALDNNLGLKMTLTAIANNYNLTSFSFMSARDSDDPTRSCEYWCLLADQNGNGFDEGDLIARGAIPLGETWGLNKAVIDLQLADNGRMELLLVGLSPGYNDKWARETALDDISFAGVATASDNQLLAHWSFEDQGPNAFADLSASTAHTGLAASDAMPRSGYAQLVQTNATGAFTYIDSTGAGAVDSMLSPINTDHAYFMVGDWKDGSPRGGNIFAQLLTLKSVDPVGTALSGSGALYLNSKPNSKNNIQNALVNNLGVSFSLTGTDKNFALSSLSFWLARDNDTTKRTWESWYLLASNDNIFTADEVVASGTTQSADFETWTKHTAELAMKIPRGTTRHFLLIGTCTESSDWGRETAIADIIVQGNEYIAAGSLIMVQ